MFKYELLEFTADAMLFPVPPGACMEFDMDCTNDLEGRWCPEMMKLPYYKNNFYKLTRDFSKRYSVGKYYISEFDYGFIIKANYLRLSIEHFLKSYDRLDDETKLSFSNFLENPNFKKAVFLCLEDSEAMHYFFNAFCNSDNLVTLDCLDIALKHNTKMQNTIIIAQLLEYRNKHFSKQEITDYYDREERLLIGLEFLSESEFDIDWLYTKENDEITITGYKGKLTWIQIPKMLDDGTKIVKIDSHILSQDKYEFLYVYDRNVGGNVLPISLSKEHKHTFDRKKNIFSAIIRNLSTRLSQSNSAYKSQNCYIFE